MKFKNIAAIILASSLSACVHNSQVSTTPSSVATPIPSKKFRKPSQKKQGKTFDIIGNTEGENDINYDEYLDVIPFSIDEKSYTVKGKTYTTKIDIDYKETGLASWYAGKFQGRRTSSGVRFDASMFTAAHRTLPIPSVVRVVNIENQRSTLVVVNDRGPFSGNNERIIDLSKKAAEHLGLLNKGVGKVQVEYLLQESRELMGKLPATQQKQALVAYQRALTRQMAKAHTHFRKDQ